MLRYKTKTRPGLVALYDIRPGNGAGPFLQPRSPHGAGRGGKGGEGKGKEEGGRREGRERKGREGRVRVHTGTTFSHFEPCGADGAR